MWKNYNVRAHKSPLSFLDTATLFILILPYGKLYSEGMYLHYTVHTIGKIPKLNSTLPSISHNTITQTNKYYSEIQSINQSERGDFPGKVKFTGT